MNAETSPSASLWERVLEPQNAACSTWSASTAPAANSQARVSAAAATPDLVGRGARSLGHLWSGSGASTASPELSLQSWLSSEGTAPRGDPQSLGCDSTDLLLVFLGCPTSSPASCLWVQELCVLGVQSMFSFLLPPSSLYFVSQSNTVLQGVFGKVKKANLGRSLGKFKLNSEIKKKAPQPLGSEWMRNARICC